MRHADVNDVTAQMLKEVCHDAQVEPMVLPLTGEILNRRSTNASNDARLGVTARVFGTSRQKAYLDINIFDIMVHCHRDLTFGAAHWRNGQEKKKKLSILGNNTDCRPEFLNSSSLHDDKWDGTKSPGPLRKTRRNIGR